MPRGNMCGNHIWDVRGVDKHNASWIFEKVRRCKSNKTSRCDGSKQTNAFPGKVREMILCSTVALFLGELFSQFSDICTSISYFFP